MRQTASWMRFRGTQSAPFQVGAKFEPLFNPLQIDIRFLPDPLPSIPWIPFTGSLHFLGVYRAYQVLCLE
jgi:hypothetical protein